MNLLSVLRQRSQKLFRQSKLTAKQCLSIEVLEERAVPTVSGVVFQDFNSNGTRDLTSVVTSPPTTTVPPIPAPATVSAAVDRGIAGVTVTAFDGLGVNRGSAVTDAFGAYTLTVSGAQTDPLRVEFTTLPTGFTSGPRGADSGTAVQFVPNGSATNVNFGAVRPVDHSQDNPLVATSVYAYGNQQSTANAARTTLVAFPYSSGGTSAPGFTTPDPTKPVLSVLASEVGTTLGLGYSKQSRDLYAAAYFKRFAGFGPSGTGAIYSVPVPATLPANYQPNATLFADLNTLFGAGTAGANLHDATDYDTDNGNTGWAAVGTSSLGGLDVSDDGKFVFVMNLADRQLYRVPTDVTPTSANVIRVSIPLTNPDSAVIAPGTFAPGDLRPFAVEYHQGKVYVGVVYTAQSRTITNATTRQAARDELLAAVYVVDPATMAFTAAPVFTARLNYPRSQSIYQGRSEWEPWSPTYFSTAGNGGTGIAPQPMLTGLTFDAQGNLTLGIRDRGSDQNGFFTLSDPAQPEQRIEGFTGGDTLRATVKIVDNLGSGWTLEDNARVLNNITSAGGTLGVGTQDNDAGPGTRTDPGKGFGEFFYQETYSTFHEETSIGGTAQLPGSPNVLTTAMDPGGVVRAGGVSFFSTLTGAKVKAYQLYVTSDTVSNPNEGTFGKANGMGELVILSDLAPIEVGNRVFFDANGDGVQGANEPGVAGVTVRLYAPDGTTVLGTAVTDANGEYSFSSGPGTSTGSSIYGVTGLTANTAGYSIRFDNPADYAAGGPLRNRAVTKALNDATANGTSRDSDATLPNPGNPIGAGNFPRVVFGTGAPGQNVHTYDAGFSPPLSLGNRVFLDANNNGLREATEVGVAGVTVTLFTAAGVPVGAVVTDGTGHYLFTGLNAGSYYVELSTIPNGLRSSTGAGVTGGVAVEGAAPSADNNADNDDNGTQVGSIVRSTVITLALTTEPVNEGDVGSQTDTAPDNSSNLTLDLGLIRTFSLGNRVWNDANNDGLLNNGEAGINGVTVRLLDAAGNPILVGGVGVTTTTAGGGYYRFDGLLAGDYRVGVDGGGPLAGLLSSSGTNGSLTGAYEPGADADNGVDSDDNGSAFGANFRSGVVTLGPTNVEPTNDADLGPGDAAATPNDQSNFSVDFGFYRPLNLGNQVFNDRNNNGIFDAGEVGIANVPVRLYNALGGLVLSTSTNGTGVYSFGNLAAGDYQVEADLPAGFRSSTPTAANPNNDVDNDDNGTPTVGQTVRSGTVTLTPGGEPTTDGDGANGNQTVDFGAFVPLSLGNVVWNDFNNDGLLNNGEAGIGNVVVRLLDAAGNPVLGVGGVAITTTTNGSGQYLFTNLGAGIYIVEVVAPAGFSSSQGVNNAYEPPVASNVDNDDNGTSAGGQTVRSLPVTLAAGTAPTGEPALTGLTDLVPDSSANYTVDFGLYAPPPMSLGNRVWLDANNNGLRDGSPAEAGVAGVTVTLFTSLGAPVTATVTDGTGHYLFTNLTPGSYYVELSNLPAGLVSSTGTGVAVGVGGTPGPYEGTQTPSGNSDLDDDDNGTQVGPIVRSTTITLTPFTEPTNEGDRGSQTDTATDLNGNLTLDLGLIRVYSLGNRVWNDANNDGLLDIDNESGINGVTVRLLKADGTPVLDAGGVAVTTTTVGGGYYAFDNLLAGDYRVGVDGGGPLTGYLSSSGTNGSLTGPYEPGADADNGVDSDDNGSAFNGNFRSEVVTLGPTNSEPTGESDVTETPFSPVDDQSNFTVDFGFYRPIALGNLVWNDLNNNGTRDSGEPGLANVRVRLLNSAGTQISSTTTDGLGNYLFTNLTPGDYIVEADLPTGFVSSSGTNGRPTGPFEPAPSPNGGGGTDNDDNGSRVGATQTVRSLPVTLASGITSNLTVDFSGYVPLNLGNLVWNDANNNGTRETGELGIDGVTVNLFADANGDGDPDSVTPVATTVTAGGGLYLFTNLSGGGYVVSVPTGGPLAGLNSSSGTNGSLTGPFEPGATGDTDNDDNGRLVGGNFLSGTVTLSPGGEPANDGDGTDGNLTVDFGFYQPLSLGNLVFNDVNNNGKFDAATEKGLSGVPVRLFNSAGVQVGVATATDGSGNYLFTNLTPGDYTVQADLPTGFVSSSGKNGSVSGPFEPAPSPNGGGGVDNDDNGTRVGATQTVVSLPVALVTGGTNSNLTVDFGAYVPLSLGNLVFNDANNNGTRESGESGLVGVVVRAFDSANNPVGTTTTDASGNYLFTNLNPGDYSVEADLPTGFVTSTGANGKATGLFEPGADANNDTDNDDNGSKTNGQTVRTSPVTLSVGGEPGGGNVNLTVDFGAYLPLSLGNRVWDDLNNNGVRDAGEPGLNGVTVTLFTAASASVAATSTDKDGYYLFTNLNPNGYYVQLSTLPSGYVSSTGAAGSVGPFEGASTPSADSNADNDDNGTQVGAVVRSTVITLAVGTEPTGELDVGTQVNNASDADTNFTLDLGLTRTYSLGNRVFLDGNNDGLRNVGEAGIDGVTVRLLKADGTPILDTAGVAVTTTTANGGYYRFDGLTAGDYRVQVDGTGPLAGLRSSTGASGVAGTPGPFEAAPSPNNDVDDDDNGTQVGVNALSGVVTLGPGNSEPVAEADKFEGDLSTPDAQSNLTLDFGFFRPVALGNRVFLDANNNGKFDAGDSAPAGPVTLALLDGTGVAVLDGAGKAVTTTTNAAGYYLFTGLNPGKYQVSVPAANFATGGALANSLSSTGAGPGSISGPNEPAPATPVDNADSGTAALGGVLSPVLTLADGTAPTGEPDAATIADPTADADGNLTVDFGFYQPLTLGNLVFNDLNNNGRRDANEPGLANVPVRLFNAQNGLVSSTTTDANGNYLFTNLTPGDYAVEADLPAGFKSSTSTAANPNDDVDNDDNGTATTGQTVRSFTVTLTAGGEPTTDGDGPSGNLTVDFGAFVPLSLGNLVWNDANNNGKFDAGEAGLAKVAVNLYADVNADGVPDSLTPLATTVTDGNGNYLFTNLGQGTYVVGLPTGGPLAGLNSSSGTNGSLTGPFELAPGPNNDVDNDDNGSLVGINFLSGPVTLTPGGEPGESNTNLTVDFGFYQPISLGNLVFNDANNNGKLDAGEAGLANVPVRAFDAAGKLVGSTTTDGNGNYLFTNLTPGDYAVEADLPSGFVSSSGTNGSPTGPSETAPTPNNGVDSDDNGTKTTGQTVRSSPVTLVTGGTNSNLTVDFGGYVPLSLGNLVFNDINNNGVRDANEPGLANVPVRAFDAAGALVGSTTTDANGNYLFTNLTPGNYAVEADLPAGFVTSTGTNGRVTGPFETAPSPNNGTDNDDNGTKTTGQTVRSSPVALVPGGTNSNLTVDFGGYQPLSFGNLIWNDLNNNGRFDANEPGLANVPVQLFNAGGTLVSSTTTDANGNYLFTNLTPGDYTIGVTPPTGFSLGANAGSSPNNGVDNDNNGTVSGGTIRSLPVTLTLGSVSGALNPTIDIGLAVVPTASVSGFAYRDNDLTATYTPGLRNDTPLGGVTVTLTGTDRNGNPVPARTTKTNAQGFYEFTGLPAGNYTVTETPPNGFYYHGADNPGSLGGTSPATRVLTVSLNAGDAGRNYNFGELVPADPFGYVYADLNNNGVRNAGEPGIAGVAVTISGTAFAGTPFARPLTAADVPGGLTSVTNSSGRWEFPVMPPGLYSVVEGAVPAPFTDGLEQNGDPTAPPPQVGNDRFDSISLSPQLVRGPLNFGELVPESTKRNFLASTQGLTAANAASLTRADVPINPAFTVTTGTPSVPAFVAVASGPGSVPLVRVFDYATGGEVRRFFAYESDFTGGVRVASGDVNGDGVPDIVTGIGVGGGPRIRVFSGVDGSVLFDQFVYEPTFTGGLFVATGDVNGDGRADIITGTDSGGGPRVRVLDGTTGAVLQDFFAFDPSQRGGVRVSAADFNKDGKADVVATTGAGVPTRVRVFGAGVATTILADFAPYGSDFTGGVFVAAGDVTGDGVPDLVTGADAGGGPHVQVFSGLTGQSARSFFAFESTFTGGVRVSLRDIDGDGKDDIVTAAGVGGGPAVRIYSGATGAQLDGFYATDPDNLGGVYVG